MNFIDYLFNLFYVFNFIKIEFYKPVIIERIVYRKKITRRKIIGKKNRNFFIFSKFRTGANITKIKPAKLLIKNRG